MYSIWFNIHVQFIILTDLCLLVTDKHKRRRINQFVFSFYRVFRGGYLVIPHTIEFWQGQSDRLHDRIEFKKGATTLTADDSLVHAGENGWVYRRLAP